MRCAAYGFEMVNELLSNETSNKFNALVWYITLLL